MISNDWFYLRNFFDNVTKNSMRRMYVMSRDHHDKLKNAAANDPFIAQLFQQFLPYYKDFIDAYSNNSSMKAKYEGYTMKVVDLFLQLTQKIKQWDIWIQNVYMEGTPEYQMILPNRRTPFQSGSYESRIGELRSLEKNLSNFPQLSNTHNDVSSFLQNIDQIRTDQQGVEQQDSENGVRLEEARIKLAKIMHGIFGALLYHYWENSVVVNTFYERKFFEIGSSNSSSINYINYNLPAKNSLNLYENELTLNSKFLINNTSESILEIYATDDLTTPPPAFMLRLQAGEKGEYLLTEIGNGAPDETLKFLIVNNPSNNKATFKISKIEIDDEA